MEQYEISHSIPGVVVTVVVNGVGAGVKVRVIVVTPVALEMEEEYDGLEIDAGVVDVKKVVGIEVWNGEGSALRVLICVALLPGQGPNWEDSATTVVS